MEKFIKSPLENYGIYINLLWHISYAIILLVNVVMEGFVMGLTLGWWTMRDCSELDYTGASLIDQYPITLVHIVGFKIIKN